jgi:hypothetical protein
MDDQYYFGNDTPDISSYLNTYKPLSLSLDEPSHSVRITVGLVLKALSLTVLVMWTVAANMLVFVVLYKNPRLQTVPNLLVIFNRYNFL